MLGQQIMSFMKGLVGPRVLRSSLVDIIVTKMGGNVGNDVFFHPLLGPVMTCNEHEMLTMFLKLNPHVFFV